MQKIFEVETQFYDYSLVTDSDRTVNAETEKSFIDHKTYLAARLRNEEKIKFVCHHLQKTTFYLLKNRIFA